MREILIRGIWTETGDWVKGFYVRLFDSKGNGSHRIYPGYAETDCGDYYPDWYEVDPETVGQFTGLTDKNGKKIFEGDIVKTHYANTKKSDFTEQVVFHNGRFCSMFTLSKNGRMFSNLADGIPHLPQDNLPYMEWCEVIGNIHDNPELLKEG